MVIKANAKINLAIDVRQKVENGYHDVDMVTLPIELHDVLEIEPLAGSRDMYLTADDPTIICDETNLAYKAFGAMRKNFVLRKGYRIQIYKRIPTEAGLGGGSADAAGVIRAICKAYGIAVNDPKVIAIARSVGSDIPFCLLNIPARVKGTGEIIEPLPDARLDYGVLIVKPKTGLATKDVFAAYDRMDPASQQHPNIEALLEAIKDNDEAGMKRTMVNGLLRPALELCPLVGDILVKMEKMGFPLFSMSGAGSACFGLSKDRNALERAEAYFNSLGYVAVVSSTRVRK